MPFQAHSMAMRTIPALKDLVKSIQLHDPGLADQLRRAASSMVLNIGEGSRRQGRDRIQRYRIAAGSAAETRDALEVARGWGYVDSTVTAPPLEMLDRVLAMLWVITHKGA